MQTKQLNTPAPTQASTREKRPFIQVEDQDDDEIDPHALENDPKNAINIIKQESLLHDNGYTVNTELGMPHVF